MINRDDCFKQTFEFKLTRADDSETVLTQSYPSGANFEDIIELFKSFLKAITYPDSVANSILNDEDEE